MFFFLAQEAGHVQYRCIFFRTRTTITPTREARNSRSFNKAFVSHVGRVIHAWEFAALLNNRMVNNERVQLSQR